MKLRIAVLLACSVLMGGVAYSCSSPPAHAPSAKQKAEVIDQPVAASHVFVLKSYDVLELTQAVISESPKSVFASMCMCATVKNVSMAAYGHAIRQCVATGLNSNVNSKRGTSYTSLHIDPGLRNC